MNEVRGEFNDGKLVIFLSGHIDSNNAPLVEAEVLKELEGRDIQSIVLDVGELAYISSAGLRVLLRIRKSNENMKIINANSEVFEVLDMTGFTQMIEVEKAYREVSIEGCEVIGQGANGTLYRIDKDNVVKVYNNADALADIQNEREMAKTALILGIPTAISYDVVKVNGSYGSVFELLNASSFAKILQTQPDKFDWCVQEFTGMLNRIHSTVVPKGKLPDIKKTVTGWVEFMKDYLPADAHQKLKRMVFEVPHDDHMIHGDYHIKNLELTDNEVLLIDMDTLAVGHPIFELASMYNAFHGFSEYDHENVKNFLGIDYETSLKFLHDVFACYLSTDDEEKINEVEEKARIIGYVRMIRRSIRRKGLEDENKKAEIELWKSELLKLLDKVDTLLFTRDEIVVEAKVENLQDVLNFVDSHLDKVGCDPATQMKLQVAVEELFVNIAHYAYKPGSGDVAIGVNVTKEPKSVTISFKDSGVPFNPLAKEEPDITLKAEERGIGGLGIYMVRKTMDEMTYEYKDGQNILSMKKFF
ncbi:MAG: anti-sigma factor antagonist [Lachnospiraceae bacterium]|nr:anti-sigma factor antagonist [Lachnospiraceae bacterium]